MEDHLRVLGDGPVVLLAGIVFLLFGGSGLLAGQKAAYTRREEGPRWAFLGMLLIGLLLTGSGVAFLLA